MIKINRLVIALVVCALMSLTAIAKDKSEMVTIPQDVVINGTLVKKGEYKLKFDEKSGELLIMKGKKVVAKTSAKLEQRTAKAGTTEFNMLNNGENKELVGITFRGENERIVFANGNSQPATAQ